VTPQRILLDQMLDEGVAVALRERGHDVVRVTDVGMATAGDDEILARAIVDHRVLVTLDEHFGDWVVLPLRSHAGVVRVKATPTTTTAVLALLVPLLDAHAPADFENCLVIVRRTGTRWVHTTTRGENG